MNFGAANCASCPLRERREGGPVPSEFNVGALGTVVAEAPGEKECEGNRPLIGPSGMELQRAFSSLGVRRNRFNYVNSLSCRPPANDLRRFLHGLQQENKKRERDHQPRLPSPFDCCRPRLLEDLKRGTQNVITLGATAYKALTGSDSSILEIRGGPTEAPVEGHVVVRLLPTLHPAFVVRARRWTKAFRADLSRAVRWFTTGLGWKDPATIYRPTVEQLREFLSIHTPYFVFDVETAPAFPQWEMYEPMLDPLRCLGLCTADGSRAVVVPFRSKEYPGKVFYGHEGREIVEMLRAFFVDPAKLKAGHNAGYYDRLVIEHEFKVRPLPLIDSIGLHKCAEPELPHRLGYVGSVYTDVDSWKQGHLATEAETDEELWEYNVKDNAVTALSIGPLVRAVRERKQDACAKFFHVVQDFCVGFHRNGMFVDQAKRAEWDKKLYLEAREAERVCQDIALAAGFRNFNPGSTMQLRDLLFERWNILPHDWTELGDPSTGDDSLRAFIMSGTLSAEQTRFVKSLRRFRERVKLRGTYVLKLRPVADDPLGLSYQSLAWDEEESFEERERRIEKAMARPGRVLADGRIHPDYNAHGTVGWRLSSSNPNAQNFPAELRNMIVAAPGRVLVGCDQAQLELRMVAALAKAGAYLAEFEREGDPHKSLCIAFFGEKFLASDKAQQKKLRVFIKQFTYGSLYRAGVETIHSILTSAEDRETKELLWPELTLRETGALHRMWLDRNPEIEQWWESDFEEWKRDGFLAEPIFGLRCDFLDGEDPNKIANYKAQAGGAALVHKATERFVEKVPFGRWGPGTGLIANGHDQLVAEVPEAEGEWVAKYLTECMTIDGRPYGLPVTFKGEAQIGHTWADV